MNVLNERGTIDEGDDVCIYCVYFLGPLWCKFVFNLKMYYGVTIQTCYVVLCSSNSRVHNF